MKTLIIVSLIGMVMISGCSISYSCGVSADAFYPEGETAKGTKFGDPHRSRREAMKPTTGHVRNNDGGNKTDKFCREFFKTE